MKRAVSFILAAMLVMGMTIVPAYSAVVYDRVAPGYWKQLVRESGVTPVKIEGVNGLVYIISGLEADVPVAEEVAPEEAVEEVAAPEVAAEEEMLKIERTPEELADVIASATATETYYATAEALAAGVAADGTWIINALADVEVEGTLTVDGEILHGTEVARKLALYEQDTERNVTAEYVLTVGEMIVNSPNFNITNGKVVGNITVNANGFELRDAQVDGNIIFASAEIMATAIVDRALVTGMIDAPLAEEDKPFTNGVLLKDAITNVGGTEITVGEMEDGIFSVAFLVNEETVSLVLDPAAFTGTVSYGDSLVEFGCYMDLGFNYVVEEEFLAALAEVGVAVETAPATEEDPFENAITLGDAITNAGGTDASAEALEGAFAVAFVLNGETVALSIDIEGRVGTVTYGDATAEFRCHLDDSETQAILGLNFVIEEEFLAALAEVGLAVETPPAA